MKQPTLLHTIVAGVAIAVVTGAVAGGLVLWKGQGVTEAVISTQISNLCDSVTSIKQSAEQLKVIVTALQISDGIQNTRIEALEKKHNWSNNHKEIKDGKLEK